MDDLLTYLIPLVGVVMAAVLMATLLRGMWSVLQPELGDFLKRLFNKRTKENKHMNGKNHLFALLALLLAGMVFVAPTQAHEITGGGTPPPEEMMMRFYTWAYGQDCQPTLYGVLDEATREVNPNAIRFETPRYKYCDLDLPHGVNYYLQNGQGNFLRSTGLGDVILKDVQSGTLWIFAPPAQLVEEVMSWCDHCVGYSLYPEVVLDNHVLRILPNVLRYEGQGDLRTFVNQTNPDIKYRATLENLLSVEGKGLFTLENIRQGRFEFPKVSEAPPAPPLMLQRMTVGCTDCADKFGSVVEPNKTVNPRKLRLHTAIEGGLTIPMGIEYTIFIGQGGINIRHGFGPVVITDRVASGLFEARLPDYETLRQAVSWCVDTCTVDNLMAVTSQDGIVQHDQVVFDALMPGIGMSIPNGVTLSVTRADGSIESGFKAETFTNLIHGDFKVHKLSRELMSIMGKACPSCFLSEFYPFLDDEGNVIEGQAEFYRIGLTPRDFVVPQGMAYSLTLEDCTTIEGEGPFFVLNVAHGFFRILPPPEPNRLYLSMVIG